MNYSTRVCRSYTRIMGEVEDLNELNRFVGMVGVHLLNQRRYLLDKKKRAVE